MQSSPPISFELTYRIERQDYRQMMHAYWSLTSFRRWRVRFLMAIPAAAAILGLAEFVATRDPRFLLMAAVGASAFGLAPAINVHSYDRVYHRLDLAEKEIRLTADPTGMSTAMTSKGESKLPWSAVTVVTARPAHLFLWLNPYNAVIVPRRAFPDAATADLFDANVREWVSAAAR